MIASNISSSYIQFFVLFILLTFWCTDKEVFIFIFALFFKCISLSVAIAKFTTTLTFEWESIETIFYNHWFWERPFYGRAHICIFCRYLVKHCFFILKVGFVCIMTIDSKKGMWLWWIWKTHLETYRTCRSKRLDNLFYKIF